MNDYISLSHGGGGRTSSLLMKNEILPRFGSKALKGLPDAAEVAIGKEKVVFSTDSFVVNPIMFPGGNIGELAVFGTINDICVAGGDPVCLSLALIIEEGLPFRDLRTILDSIKKASDASGVEVVTGDTKVVPKGQCDGIYINTSGIGLKIKSFNLGRKRIKPGDSVIVSGTIGEHGFAILTARHGINIKNGPVSDCAPVIKLVKIAERFGDKIRFMRDPTRGGLAAVLNEIAENASFGITIEQNLIPLSPAVSAVSEILGLDPLSVACEGRIVLVCENSIADTLLREWKKLPEGKNAANIGETSREKGRVIIKTWTGGRRFLDMPDGELLPRIC